MDEKESLKSALEGLDFDTSSSAFSNEEDLSSLKSNLDGVQDLQLALQGLEDNSLEQLNDGNKAEREEDGLCREGDRAGSFSPSSPSSSSSKKSYLRERIGKGHKKGKGKKKWNADQILPGLFMGDLHAASDKENLKSHNITHILNVAGGEGVFPNDFTYMIINAFDSKEYDMISWLPKTNQFIRDAISSNGSVLVHCQKGISRSGVLVIAYVMVTLEKPFYEAAVDKRPVVCPNLGFLKQLQLFEAMKYNLDGDSEDHKTYNQLKVRSLLTDELVKWREKPQEVKSPYLGDGLKVYGDTYICKNCKNPLFRESHQLLHEKGEGSKPTGLDCDTSFTVPFSWMGDISPLEGDMKCSKCSVAIGKWHWQGLTCACGHICKPAFALNNKMLALSSGKPLSGSTEPETTPSTPTASISPSASTETTDSTDTPAEATGSNAEDSKDIPTGAEEAPQPGEPQNEPTKYLSTDFESNRVRIVTSASASSIGHTASSKNIKTLPTKNKPVVPPLALPSTTKSTGGPASAKGKTLATPTSTKTPKTVSSISSKKVSPRTADAAATTTKSPRTTTSSIKTSSTSTKTSATKPVKPPTPALTSTSTKTKAPLSPKGTVPAAPLSARPSSRNSAKQLQQEKQVSTPGRSSISSSRMMKPVSPTSKSASLPPNVSRGNRSASVTHSSGKGSTPRLPPLSPKLSPKSSGIGLEVSRHQRDFSSTAITALEPSVIKDAEMAAGKRLNSTWSKSSSKKIIGALFADDSNASLNQSTSQSPRSNGIGPADKLQEYEMKINHLERKEAKSQAVIKNLSVQLEEALAKIQQLEKRQSST